MRLGLAWSSGIGMAACLLPCACLAQDFGPKEDNHIVCLELASGKTVWDYVPVKLRVARFELYRDGLISFPTIRGEDVGVPWHLNCRTGVPVAPFPRNESRLLSTSPSFSDNASVLLQNGWRLAGFSQGSSKSLKFADRLGKVLWTIEAGTYVDRIVSWKNLVFVTKDYLSEDAVVFAYQAGKDRPLWTVDLNKIVMSRDNKLTRKTFQTIGETLLVQSHENVFAFEARTGKLLWHRNLAKDLGLKYQDFFGGPPSEAVFSKCRDVLVVSFERRVVAIDLRRNKYLWHLDPDTFPHLTIPFAYGDYLFLTAGAKRKLHRLK